MGHLTRQPTSNDPPPPKTGKNRWLGENEFADEVALLLNNRAKRCVKCHRAIRVEFLDQNQRCPDCR